MADRVPLPGTAARARVCVCVRPCAICARGTHSPAACTFHTSGGGRGLEGHARAPAGSLDSPQVFVYLFIYYFFKYLIFVIIVAPKCVNPINTNKSQVTLGAV